MSWGTLPVAGSHFGLKREPWLAQHEAQQEGFGVRGSGHFMLGDPTSGQGHSTRASWLGRAQSPLQKHPEVPTWSSQSSCSRAGWLALRLGSAPHTPASPDFPRILELLCPEAAFIFSRENISVRMSFLFYYFPSLAAGSIVLAPGVGPGSLRQPFPAAVSCHVLLTSSVLGPSLG